MWTRLEDISKVFRVTDGITPPGSRRVVKNCLEIHCARFTTFVMAKSSSEVCGAGVRGGACLLVHVCMHIQATHRA